MTEPVVVTMSPETYFVRWLIVLTSLSVSNGIIMYFAVKWAVIAAARYLQAEGARTAVNVASNVLR